MGKEEEERKHGKREDDRKQEKTKAGKMNEMQVTVAKKIKEKKLSKVMQKENERYRNGK